MFCTISVANGYQPSAWTHMLLSYIAWVSSEECSVRIHGWLTIPWCDNIPRSSLHQSPISFIFTCLSLTAREWRRTRFCSICAPSSRCWCRSIRAESHFRHSALIITAFRMPWVEPSPCSTSSPAPCRHPSVGSSLLSWDVETNHGWTGYSAPPWTFSISWQ